MTGRNVNPQEHFSSIDRNQMEFEYSGVVSDLQKAGKISGVTRVEVQLSRVSLLGPYVDPVEIGVRERPSFETANIQTVTVL